MLCSVPPLVQECPGEDPSHENCWLGILLASRPRFACGMEGAPSPLHGTASWGSLGGGGGDAGCVKAHPVRSAWFLSSSPRPVPYFLKATGQRFTVKSSLGYPKAISGGCSGHSRSCCGQGEGWWPICNPGRQESLRDSVCLNPCLQCLHFPNTDRL